MKSRYCGFLLTLTIGIVSCVAKAQSRPGVAEMLNRRS